MRTRESVVRLTYLAMLVGIVAAAGCASYPTKLGLLHGGHIQREHGKPSEGGYYQNFDPEAVTLEPTFPI